MQAGTHCHFNLSYRFKTLRLFLLLSSVLLTACGGGSGTDGDTTDTAGTDTNPTVTDGSSPLSEGTTHTNVAAGTINYTVSGLSATTIYNVWIHNLTNDVALTTYLDSGFQFSSCTSNNAGTAIEECLTTTSADGKLFLSVASSASTTYSITVKPVPANEGSVESPVSLSVSTSTNGQVSLGTSYYKLTGLTPGLVYDINMSSILSEADLKVSLQKDYVGLACQSANTGSQDENCQAPANFLGELYIKATSPGFGAYYSLTVTPTSQTENIFEGFSDTPVDVTGQLPYNGTVNYDNSYYKFTGLTPGVRYEVRITNNTVNTTVFFYDPLTGAGCDLYYGSAVIETRLCVATAPESGNLYLSIPYNGTPGGSYTIDLGLAPVAEGMIDAPKEIVSTAMPYDGQVDTTMSYYVITGLVPNYVYEVQMNGATHQYTEMAIGDSISTFPTRCNLCSIRSNASGEIYIRIDGTGTDNENNDLGAWFTLAFGDAEHSEGSIASPVSVPADGAKYRGQSDDTLSYYQVTGLEPGAIYQIYTQTLDSSYASASPNAYSDSTYATWSCLWVSGICLAEADSSGNLYVGVSGYDIEGSRYDLWIQPSPYHSEGSEITPLDITNTLVTAGSTSHRGSVNYHNRKYSTGGKIAYSYYQLTGLPGTTNYSIVASNMTDNVNLTVYSDSNFTTQLCRVRHAGLNEERCDVVTAPTGGAVKNVNLYIKVDYEDFVLYSGWDGAKFDLTVSAGGAPLVNQGAPGAPVDITGSLPYVGSVRYNSSSYYRLTGLNPSTIYSVKASHPKTRIDLSSWTDNTYSMVSCRQGTLGEYGQIMGCPTTATGELFIEVENMDSTDTAFTLEIIDTPVAEGTVEMPVDITTNLPYSGQALADGVAFSYYTVTGLTPSSDYLVLRKNGINSPDVSVYGAADFTSDFQCTHYGSPVASTCKATANSNGELYIRVKSSNQFGSLFDLDISPAAVDEGTIVEPVNLSLQTVYRGQTDISASYYVVTGLTPFSGHHVGLKTQDDVFTIKIFADENFQKELCVNSHDYTATGCGATADINGEIYFEISGNSRGFYDLYIQ